MPSVSRAQHKMMTAVANNPKFAKKTGVPQSVGEEFMKADKKMKKYQEGGMTAKQSPISQEDIDRMMMEGESEYQSTMSSEDREKRQKAVKEEDMKKKMAPKKPKKIMGGGMATYKKGGSVRGAGCATKGVRPCKMC